jgi:hypothetical protein
LTLGISGQGAVEWIRSGAASIAGVTADAVVIATDNAVQAISPQNGQVAWKYQAGKLAAAPVVADGSVLVADWQEPDDGAALRLTWIGAGGGRETASCSAPGWNARERIELLFPAQKQLFALVSREREPNLSVIELESAMPAAESRF